MNKTFDIPPPEVPGKFSKFTARGPSRYFYFTMAILFPIITFIGFFPSFQSEQRGTLEVHWLTHIHSAIMTSWLLLYLTQTFLVASGNLHIHKRLGVLSFTLGILVQIIMLLISVHLVIANHPPAGSVIFDILLFDFYSISGFALFFWWGMNLRKKDPSSHKRLLTFATFALLIAAVDRVQRNNSFPSLGLDYPLYSFVYLDILLIPIFLYDLIGLRRIHRSTLIAITILIIMQVTVIKLFNSNSWHKLWHNAFAPFMEKVVAVKLTGAQIAPLLGIYESKLGNITISSNNDKIYVQFNDDPKQEVGATSETKLFLLEEAMTISFTKNPDGKVTAAEAKEIGEIFKMAKIK